MKDVYFKNSTQNLITKYIFETTKAHIDNNN